MKQRWQKHCVQHYSQKANRTITITELIKCIKGVFLTLVIPDRNMYATMEDQWLISL